MTSRYSAVAIALHWAIALAILGLLPVGLWMSEAIDDPQADKFLVFKTFQLHKSAGLTVLVLSLIRLGWRLGHKPPPLPPGMGPAARRAARAAHVVFYILMIGLPLTGWAMVSASPLGLPTIWFGWFEWPHLPWLAALEDKKPVEQAFELAHAVLAKLAIGLILIHVAAALKHHWIDRDDVLARMLPGLRTRA